MVLVATMVRWFFYIVTVVVVLLLVLIHGFGFGSTGLSAANVEQFFIDAKRPQPVFAQFNTTPGTINVVHTRVSMAASNIGVDTDSKLENSPLPILVFIHGSPGDWTAFIEYFNVDTLNKRYQLVAVDRPGFGGSDAGVAVPSLAEQSRRLVSALKQSQIGRNLSIDVPVATGASDQNIQLKKPNTILVGHSMGGPLAARIAADYPSLVAGLVLVAPSMDPELEGMRWYNEALHTKLAAWLLPQSWVTSNREIMSHKHQLQLLKRQLHNIKAPTVVIQGMEDTLVSPANADYVERNFEHVSVLNIIRLEGMNHFIPWSHPQVIIDSVLAVITESSQY